MKIVQLVVTAIFAFLGGMTFQLFDAGGVGAKSAGKPAEVEATKFTLVNDKGAPVGIWSDTRLTVRGSLSVEAEGQATTRFLVMANKKLGVSADWEASGKLAVRVSGGGGTPRLVHVSLYDEAGKGTLMLGPTSIDLRDKDGKHGLWLAPDFINLFDIGGNRSLAMTPAAIRLKNKAARDSLLLRPTSVSLNKDEKDRLVLGRTSKGKPAIFFYDGEGNQVGLLGGK